MEHGRWTEGGDWEYVRDGQVVARGERDPVTGELAYRTVPAHPSWSEQGRAAFMADRAWQARRARRVLVGCVLAFVVNVMASFVAFRVYEANGQSPAWLAVVAGSVAVLGPIWLAVAWTHRSP